LHIIIKTLQTDNDFRNFSLDLKDT